MRFLINKYSINIIVIPEKVSKFLKLLFSVTNS
jgi:hypothetical protein